MTYRRSLDTLGSLQVAERWVNGVRTYSAWFTFQPGRVGYGATRSEAMQSIPRRKAALDTSLKTVVHTNTSTTGE